MRGISRRLLMGVSMAGFSLGLPDARGRPAKAPRRTTLSVNMRSDEQRVVQIPELTTYMATLPLETGATSLRIGLANTTPHPYRIDGICVCESAEWIPSGPPGWAYFSFSGAGGGASRPPAMAPAAVTVPGNTVNATGAHNVPTIIWSDWMDFRTTSGAQRPQLLFRSLLPAQLAILAFPAGPGLVSPPLPDQFERLIAQASVPGDFVTNPNQPLPQTTPVPHSPVYVIQYRATTPGFQLIIGGDSHLAMSNTFAQLAATHLSTPERPISVWNTAWSAQASKTFWPALDQAIDLAPPSITVIQGWTANDGMTPAGDQAYLPRVKESAERTIAAGGIPIIVKNLPRHLFGNPELTSWQSIHQQLDTLVPGALIFDPLPYVEDPQAPGNWIARLSNDGVHPNGWGNLALRDPFERLFAPLVS